MIHTRQNAVDVIKYICGVFYMLRKGCTTMKLYHYYEKDNGPLRSISDLPDKKAEEVLQQIRLEKPDIFLSKRPDDYLLKRRHFEEVLRNEFIKMGGVPERLSYDDNGVISHNGKEKGYLYIIDENVLVDKDVYQHPRSVMDKNAEFLTNRPLKVKMICELPGE